jgi:hypothetical protein
MRYEDFARAARPVVGRLAEPPMSRQDASPTATAGGSLSSNLFAAGGAIRLARQTLITLAVSTRRSWSLRPS